MTLSAKTSLMLGVHKAGFRREGHINDYLTFIQFHDSHLSFFFLTSTDSHPDFRKPKPDNDKEHTSHNDVLRWRPIEEELRVRGEGPRGLEYVLVMTCFSWHSLNPLKTWRVPFTKVRCLTV